MTGPAVLAISGLTVSYGLGPDAVEAIRDVDLTLRRGEILGLAGESGSGKSTLVYGATRLLSPPGVITDGTVDYTDRDGVTRDLLRLDDAELRALRWNDIALVFQGSMNSLSPVFRIDRQLTDAIAEHEPTSTAATRRVRALELLELVGIPADRLRAYPHQLSGGMRQRVMIAMAMALQPDVVIMDEPTTALDVVMQRQILDEIMRIRERIGFSVIFITHDVSLLIEIADRIAIMYAGRIVEEGPARDLYRAPRHPYTHGLLRSFPSLHDDRRDFTGIPGSPPDLQALPAGCPFAPRCAFTIDRCSASDPDLVPSAAVPESDRLVACHRHDADAPQPVPVELSEAAR